MNVWVADIPASIPITAMPGLNTLDGPVPTRLWRAKYPDYDQEQFSGDLPDDRDVVTWVKPPIMPIPELFYKDLKAMGLKNDSTVRFALVRMLASSAPPLALEFHLTALTP